MKRVVIVGAGVIGLACAYALRRRGWEVVVVDRGPPGGACSLGNAGWVCPSVSGPLPAPGLTWTSIKWMLKSDSPLYIAPSAAPQLARWLWRFWRYCNPRDYLAGLRATVAFNQRTMRLFDALEADGVHFELHRQGLLFVFLEQSYMRQVLAEFDHLAEYGYRRPEPLAGAALHSLEPALSEEVTAGYLVEGEYHVRPESLCAGYADRLTRLGVELRTGVEVKGGLRKGERWLGVDTDGGAVEGDQVLLAAGAWTGALGRRFGVRLPVQAGKGYSLTVPVPGGSPWFTRPLYLGEARIGCSPFQGAVRFAGTMELSGLNTVLDPRRARGIRRGVRRYLRRPPGDGEGTEWVGMRPLSPDGLPLLGRAPGQGNLYIATGHAMLGVTMAPVTGEVMADLMTGRSDGAELKPFAPGRFDW